MEEMEALRNVLKSGWITMGPKVCEFEEHFARFVGVKHAVAVNSGTSALHILLESMGVGTGDEVILPSLVCMAVPYAVLRSGAHPVFTEVIPKTFNIDVEDAEKRISNKTKAIIAVHLYGHPAQLDRLEEICKKHDLLLIEDCAQAHGAEYKGNKVGSFGDAAFFSFGATKNMTTAEGGIILTDSDEIDEKCRAIRYHDQCAKTPYVGSNYKMTDIQAAMGLVQLERLKNFTERRRENARFLTKNLERAKTIRLPIESIDVYHVYHRYTIVVNHIERDRLKNSLLKMGIGCGILYDPPAHLHPLFVERWRGKLPTTESLSKKILSIPVHPGLTAEDLEYIVNGVKRSLLTD